MDNLFTVGFEFLEDFYYSLVRLKEKKGGDTEYEVTVMNANLEKQLYENNIIKETNGCLHIQIQENSKQQELKIRFAEALSLFLKIPLEKEFNCDKIY